MFDVATLLCPDAAAQFVRTMSVCQYLTSFCKKLVSEGMLGLRDIRLLMCQTYV
jgi:hypothetical protein